MEMHCIYNEYRTWSQMSRQGHKIGQILLGHLQCVLAVILPSSAQLVPCSLSD